MTVYVSNIVIHTGTDFEQTFLLEDSQTNSALDLTGYLGCAQLKRYESSTKSADFTVEFSNDRTTGRVKILLSAQTSASIKPGKYFYDILLKKPDETITRVVEGTALIKKSVTR
jgi:hypothetical protein